MGKITSKLQITLPKAVAERFGLKPGDDIEFVPAGDVIRLEPPAKRVSMQLRAKRLAVFDQATQRQRDRDRRSRSQSTDRGWTREELYDLGRSH
jgi:AbrB family looped-hinge helix DNA binding protein